ncbi:hypothetical protein [Amycolatopsis sp. H20-H5]|uniref:hypothetical protein n=1 Tax=Amycolatopsis sp. H20-H5 TaxID=3046309 RepID=UPI002DBB3164|nr:hypothetical protein [Amycolatopsis sp. H20-H5]MEC3981853.1 hypothetical protein [Amycolatopsis sp. H20-H5]
MAMNLRLRPEVEEALRAESERTGRSQQDLLREAVDRQLGLVSAQPVAGEPLLAGGIVQPPRVAYRKVRPEVRLPAGVDSLHLLDRDDRF